MTFDESQQYLLSLGNEVSTMKLGLENIRKLLSALDNPHQNYLKVQVAGTNGKGSVCAFLDAICVSAGIRTGLFTSPHLISITERIKIGGREISEEDFAAHATKIREIAENLVAKGILESIPTFFEQVTAIAMSVFTEENVELAILETGLGGRFDATTAANAEIVAITAIDYDHQKYLGETLPEIAYEKAATIHSGSKVVVAEQKEEALQVILAVCSNAGLSPSFAKHVSAAQTGGNTSGSECVEQAKKRNSSTATVLPASPITFETDKAIYEKVRLGLIGRHQIENAKVAILLAETLQESFAITPENIIGGLETAKHPGRLEYNDSFLFDGAHNIAGAKALREYLDEFVKQSIIVIFGAMRDKDVSKMAKLLFRKADRIILTTVDNSRAWNAAELLDFVPSDIDKKNLFLTRSLEEAIRNAREMSGDDTLICVTGSLYLIGEAQKILSSEFKL